MTGAPQLGTDAASDVARDYLGSPGASGRDLTHQQVALLRKGLDESLFLFCVLVFNFRDLTGEFHGPVCEFLDRWGREDLPGGSQNFGWKRLMLCLSRDSFKSSVATRGNALRTVSASEGGMATVGIFNVKESRTHAWIRNIRETVEGSTLYQQVYRDRIPPGIGFWDREAGRAIPRAWRWSDHAIDLVRDHPLSEPSISGHGATGSCAGWHFSHVIKDDLIEEKHAYSEVEMTRVWEWCESARYLEKPASKGNELWCYTHWTANDIYMRARRSWPDDYVVYHRFALEEDESGDERSTFPERWSTEELQRERDANPYRFSSQRQNRPRAGRDQQFEEFWLRYGTVSAPPSGEWSFRIHPEHYDPKLGDGEFDADDPPPDRIPLPWLEKVLLWDPAPSEQSAKRQATTARNGLVVAARDWWGRLFVLSARGYQEDPEAMMRLAIQTALHWGCPKVAVEEVNFSKVYKHFARYLMAREFPGEYLSWVPQKPEKRSKDARILGMIPEFASGLIYLNEPACRQLVLEYKDYPYGMTRDLLDALAMHRDVLFKPVAPDEQWLIGEAGEQRPMMLPGQLDMVNWGG